MRNEIKLQTAVEMLTTYSWAILIISIFIAAVFVLSGSSSEQQYAPASCSIQPFLPCQDAELTSYNAVTGNIVFFVSFVNQFQNPILFTSPNSINLSTISVGTIGQAYHIGDCYPNFALVGSPVLCSVYIHGRIQQPAGTRINTAFLLTYYLCQGNAQSSCQTASTYETSGYATLSIIPQNVIPFYSVTFVANGISPVNQKHIDSNATIYLNGVPYASGQKAVLTSAGNYLLFTSLASGFNFMQWSVSSVGTPSSLTSTSTENTLLVLKSNTTVTVQSENVICNVCYSGKIVTCPINCQVRRAYTIAGCPYGGALGGSVSSECQAS